MAKGDGSIIAKGRGVWEVQVSFGKNPVTGKYERVTRTVHGSKDEARKVRDRIRRDHDNGLRLDADKVTFAEFCKDYCAARRASASVEAETLEANERRLEFVCGFIGDVPMKDIGPQTIEALYPAMRERRLSQGYGFGNTTAHAYHVLIKAVFKKAVNYGYVMRNPCDLLEDAPGIDKPDRRALTAEEAARLLKQVEASESALLADMEAKEARQKERGNDRERGYVQGVAPLSNLIAVRVCLATGMRLGEAVALSWGDVEGRSIRVSRASDGRSRLKAPKTKAGIRSIEVDAGTARRLGEWRDLQRSLLGSICIEQTDETPVCCTWNGSRLCKQNFEAWWRSWREEAGFPGLRFHELRHTQATLLLANGADVKTVQSRMGHSSASLTLDWYAHAVPENDRKAAETIGRVLSGGGRKGRIIEVKTA